MVWKSVLAEDTTKREKETPTTILEKGNYFIYTLKQDMFRFNHLFHHILSYTTNSKRSAQH